jgi:hypothetical protein
MIMKATLSFFHKVVLIGILIGCGTISAALAADTCTDPVLKTIGDKSVYEEEELTFTIGVTNETLTGMVYSIVNAPSGSHFNTTSGEFNWTPAIGQNGTYHDIQFNATVDDCYNTSNITITVYPKSAKPVTATVEIKPETINLASKGVITAFITVPSGFDAKNVTANTLTCNEAPALRVMYADADGGRLIAKFSRPALVNVSPGDEVQLNVTGTITSKSGTITVCGNDTVRVINPKARGLLERIVGLFVQADVESDDTEDLSATVSIKPNTMNLGSNGHFTAFITLPAEYLVSNIDISSLIVGGAPVKKSQISQKNGGTLIVKLNRQDADELVPGDSVVNVTGNVSVGEGNEKRFEGNDTIRAIGKGKKEIETSDITTETAPRGKGKNQ